MQFLQNNVTIFHKIICIYTVFQKKLRQNSDHYNYGISYQN